MENSKMITVMLIVPQDLAPWIKKEADVVYEKHAFGATTLKIDERDLGYMLVRLDKKYIVRNEDMRLVITEKPKSKDGKRCRQRSCNPAKLDQVRCQGRYGLSKAFVNPIVDKHGNTPTRGATVSANGKAILVTVLKCDECGHSFTEGECD
jgi:hypothetical protein